MGFVLSSKADKSFWFRVDVPSVTEAGTTRVASFDMKFKRFSRSRLNELKAQSEAFQENDDTLENDTDYVMMIAEDWRHITDEKGADLAFSRENMHALLDAIPNAAGAVVGAFFKATLGGGAKTGN